MEAYGAAAPGDVIKLLAGRHVLTTHDEKDKQRWGHVYRKSVQIMANDGLSAYRVLVDILRRGEGLDGASAISVVQADIRIRGVTRVRASEYSRTGYLGVIEGGRLWLEDCTMRLALQCDRYMEQVPDEENIDLTRPADPCFAHGVAVGAGSSCFIRGCVIDSAGGPGIEIAPQAARVVIESSAITGCGCGGGDGVREWYYAGECGAIETEAWGMLHSNEAYEYNLEKTTAQVVLRQCQVIGNVGPGVSVRSPLEDTGGEDYAGGEEDTAGEKWAAARPAVAALAARITMEGCTVAGNGKEARVLTAPVGPGSEVVWNTTERRGRYEMSICCGDEEEESDGEYSSDYSWN
jgi:hypothetical protein